MSHPVRVSLRAPPHLPFIQGFPGIPGGPSRRPPGIHGTVEVRVGAVPIKAKWVRVEIRKHETIPPGFKTSSSEDKTTWEHVGEIQTLWQCTTPSKEFDILETADFKFFLPLPENIPPTVMMMKDSGIRYELVAAVCYKQKGGMFKKDASSVNKVTEDLRITKHELNSAWPLYNQPDEFNATGKGQVSMTVQRPYSAFGPNDRILLTAVLRSNEPKPFRVKGFECTLLEVVTITQVSSAQDKRKSKKVPPPTTKSRTVATARYPIDETLGKGGEKSARIDIPMSADKLLVTVRNGRSIEVGYELEVKAVCDGTSEIVIKGIKYVVGPFSRGHSQQAVRDIGHFPPLCPGPSAPHSSNPPSTRPDSPPTSPHASPPIGPPRTFTPSNPISRELGQPDFPPGFSGHPLSRPPVQGFEPTPMDNRRKSSSTITTTTTTHEFGGPPMAMAMSNSGSRSYSTMPVGRNSMPVPTPYHNGHLLRTPSYGSSVDRPLSPQLESPTTRQDEGDMRNKRYSTMTTGTFGMRDRDQLESLAETEYAEPPNGSRTPTRTPGPPSAWLPAEQEKQRLYNEARARAANIQSQTGASMQDIGMDAPPDYDTPSRHTQLSSGGSSPVIPALVLTAAEEKEQQRKRYEAATGSGSGSGTGTAPAPQSPAIGQPSFLTAAEEKEIQKKRYNDAVARGGGSSNDRPSSPMTGGMPWATLSAAEEKELQRKRYEEAAGRVASGMDSPTGSPFASGTSTPTRAEDPIPYKAIYPSRDQRPTSRIVSNPTSSTSSSPLAPAPSSRRPTSMQAGHTPTLGNSRQLPPSGAIDEKAQMKRYYEALDKVNNAAGGSGSGAGSNSYADQPPPLDSAPPPASSKPTAYLSAAEEKEQMKRRFEEASSRVNQVQGSGPRVEEPNASGLSARTPAPNASSQYMSAEEEKEQMRNRYEAATAAVGGSPSLDRSAPNGHAQGSGSGSGAAQPSNPVPIPYLSAAEEKEQMRKRFEDATAAVNRQSTQPPPAQAQSPRQMSSGSGGGSGSGSGDGSGSKPAAYLSAAEEKEQMRRRFEEATAAVNRTSTQPRDDPPQGQGSSSGSGLGSASQPSAPYMSAAEEKEQMRKRFESAQAAVSQKSPPLTQTRKVSAPIDPNAPPPPLPTRPPVEYITLLSPVDDERPPWNKVERFGMASPGAGASGQGEASGGGR